MEDKRLERMIEESGSPSTGAAAGLEEDAGNDLQDDDLVFPGFRFHPTDQELVGFYLTRKVEKKPFSIDIIKEIDIYKHDPWDLPKVSHGGVLQGSSSSSSPTEKECCYFFCLRGRKYRNSIRPNRVTGNGFWKATGIDKPIYSSAIAADCIGLKKSLVYYRGSAGRGTKTDWMMHEFRLPSTSPANNQDAEIWTICRIFKRSMTYTKGRAAASMNSSNKRIHQLPHIQHIQQQQYYYHHHDHHRRHYSCSSSLPASRAAVESSDAETTMRPAHVADFLRHHQAPFLLNFHAAGTSSSDTVTASTITGAVQPPASSSSSGWSELMSFRDGGSWDELGRIMEISTNSANYM
ncbi:hypothetical protein E2562_008065 [Oryza meyeriana var. granulata]|uniref:NAC domain-containing protein n=1 Tax=Oryza meyeriana var. granulata TaxID=110450 RepID=A0A6G1DFW5_9ORYZ|nr:hypothetical protein E2562_008065 [Oryza meyeriana var. granulata]